VHHNLGAVAGLGLYNGVFQSGRIALKGFIAWCAHRGYHGLAMPSWERKWRVIGDWWHNFWLTRDNVSLQTVQNPRYVFEEFAARPRPAVAETPAPAAAAPAAAKKAPAEKPAKATSAAG
jgi:NADH dehydrogenase